MKKWDQRFLSLAEFIAGWSKDPSTKVGCVIAGKDNRIVSLGYNGLPTGVSDSSERLMDREMKLAITVHAEVNAILFAGSVKGCTLYVWPLPPCSHCAAKIIQAGISRVISVAPDADTALRWGGSNSLAIEILTEVGIEYTELCRKD